MCCARPGVEQDTSHEATGGSRHSCHQTNLTSIPYDPGYTTVVCARPLLESNHLARSTQTEASKDMKQAFPRRHRQDERSCQPCDWTPLMWPPQAGGACKHHVMMTSTTQENNKVDVLQTHQLMAVKQSPKRVWLGVQWESPGKGIVSWSQIASKTGERPAGMAAFQTNGSLT